MRIVVLMLAGVVLAGCETAEIERARVESGLPKGCRLHDVGRYKGIDVIAVTCDGRATSTNSMSWRSGKASHRAVVTWVN